MPGTVAFLLLAVLADDLSTAVALRRGDALELNPLSARLLQLGPLELYAGKLLLAVLAIVVVSRFEPEERRIMLWALWLGAGGLIVIAGHNLLVS